MDLMLIDLLESSKAIGLCPMGKSIFTHPRLHHMEKFSQMNEILMQYTKY